MSDWNSILLKIFLITGMINLVHFGLYLGGANLYDIWQFRRQKAMKNQRSHSRQPLVSVLVPAYNEESGVIGCLESIRKNTYRKLQIIVIDNASADKTNQLVMQYICDHPNRNISLLTMSSNLGKSGALNYALQRYAHGDLIMTLDGDSILHKNAISRAVSYFKDEKVVGVAANVRVMDSLTVLGLLQKFEHMIGYRSKKFFSIINAEFIIGGVASTYRRDLMKKVGFYDTDTTTEDIGLSLKIAALGNREHRLVYASDVVAMTEGVLTFKALLRQRFRWKMGMLQNLIKNKHLFANNDPMFSRALTLYRIPMAFLGEILLMLEPFMWVYLVYLSFLFHTPALFIGAYVTITLYILWNLLPDEHTTFKRKMVLSLYAPILYFVFYIMSLVQIISIFRCLINPKQMLRKVKTEASWVSPERSATAVQFS
jgi:biofilm PGA synthesis N-glycosyltransferase PgaC